MRRRSRKPFTPAAAWLAAALLVGGPALVLAAPLPPRELDLGNRFFAREDYETAIAYYREAIERHPAGDWTDEALYLTARCLEQLGRWEQAAGAYAEVVDRAPGGAWADDALFQLGRHQAETMTREGSRLALAVFEDLLERFPDGDRAPAARVQAAGCRLLLGRWNEAEAAYLDVLGRSPARGIAGEADFGLGQVYSIPGSPLRNLTRAIRHFERVASQSPQHPRGPAARFAIGTAFRELRLYDRAIEAFQSVVENHPGSLFAPLAQSYLALCYTEKQDYARSLEAIENLIQEYPHSGGSVAEDLARLARRGEAPADKLHAAADSVDYDKERRVARYTGHVEIVHDQVMVKADRAEVDLASRTVTAEGQVRVLRSDGLQITGQRLRFDLRTREVQVEGGALLSRADQSQPPISRERIVFDLSTRSAPTAAPAGS